MTTNTTEKYAELLDQLQRNVDASPYGFMIGLVSYIMNHVSAEELGLTTDERRALIVEAGARERAKRAAFDAERAARIDALYAKPDSELTKEEWSDLVQVGRARYVELNGPDDYAQWLVARKI